MIMDRELIYSDAQAVTATADSTNIVNFGAAGDADEELYLVINVGVVMDSSGDGAKLVVTALDCATVGGSYVAFYTSPLILEATLVAGYNIVTMRLPKGTKQFTKITYTASVENFTSGNIDAYLVNSLQNNTL